jgi:arylsulfatase A-like enzyme
MSARPPDFLVVVMDCVRALDFPADTLGAGTTMPNVAALRNEAVVFERAISPATWTFPSHASLFTGLYPWESGAHAKASLKLDASIPTLPSALRAAGYDTISLSGNPVLDRSFGLVDSFDSAYWANWWEPFIRTERDPGRLRRPSYVKEEATTPQKDAGSSPLRRLRHSLLEVSPYINRFPYLMDLSTRISQGLVEPERERSLEIARWIEPTLSRWLADRAPDRPVFAFVNLIDAHEPYYTDSATAASVGDWLRYTRIRQDHFGRALERWSPTAPEMRILRGLYRNMIRRMDRRIGALRRVFEQASRWDNLCYILTSDHGQAFDEHGVLFHTLRVDEGEVRIPLWVRFPKAERGGTKAQGWASLIDIAPTVLELAGSHAQISPSGIGLTKLLDSPRPDAVLTMGDGFTWPHLTRRITPELKEKLDRPYVAGYRGDTKLILDVISGRDVAYDVVRDPEERTDILASRTSELADLGERVRAVGVRLTSSPQSLPDKDVEERLRSWGYI